MYSMPECKLIQPHDQQFIAVVKRCSAVNPGENYTNFSKNKERLQLCYDVSLFSSEFHKVFDLITDIPGSLISDTHLNIQIHNDFLFLMKPCWQVHDNPTITSMPLFSKKRSCDSELTGIKLPGNFAFAASSTKSNTRLLLLDSVSDGSLHQFLLLADHPTAEREWYCDGLLSPKLISVDGNGLIYVSSRKPGTIWIIMSYGESIHERKKPKV